MKWEVIKKFSAENKSCFSYQDVIAEYPDKDHSYLSKVHAAGPDRGIKNSRFGLKINIEVNTFIDCL